MHSPYYKDFVKYQAQGVFNPNPLRTPLCGFCFVEHFSLQQPNELFNWSIVFVKYANFTVERRAFYGNDYTSVNA